MTKRQLLRVYADRFDELKTVVETLERSGAPPARIELERRDLEEARVDLELAKLDARWTREPEADEG